MEDGAPRLIDVGVAQALQHAGLRAPVQAPVLRARARRGSAVGWACRHLRARRHRVRARHRAANRRTRCAVGLGRHRSRRRRQRVVGRVRPRAWRSNPARASRRRPTSWTPSARFLRGRSRFLRRWRGPRCAERSASGTEEPTSTPAGKTPGDTEPLPSFLSPGESNEYEPVREPDDDVSADLPLIASAGSAPMFEVGRGRSARVLSAERHIGRQRGRASARLWMRRHAAPSRDVRRLRCPGRSGLRLNPRPCRERRPFLALFIALIVGIAGGFGWGYWTAWRAAERETTVTAAPVASAPAPPSTPRLSQAPQRVDEPKVIGESKLPPPSRTARRPAAPAAASAASKPASPPRDAGKPNAVAPARSAARPKEQASRTPVATTGSLLVDSRPVGAEVSVDGRSIGVTPVTLDDLSPGDHRVVLRIPGFNLWATTAQVKAGSRTRVAASLEQAQQP